MNDLQLDILKYINANPGADDQDIVCNVDTPWYRSFDRNLNHLIYRGYLYYANGQYKLSELAKSELENVMP